MGREIRELQTGEFIMNYAFGKQPCEQYRIATELGVGEIIEVVHDDEVGWKAWDVLKIERKELPKLRYHFILYEGEKRISYYRDNLKIYKNGNFEKEKLDEIKNLAVKNDTYFWLLVKKYIEFMEEHDELSEFKFRGECM